MKIGYRIVGKMVKLYFEDRTVYHYIHLGNKRIKPDRIYKYRRRDFIVKISEKRYTELMEEMEWFEIK